MYNHTHSQIYNYSIEELYKIIVDIENYPTFIPWCYAIKILSKESNIVTAEVVVKYKTFYEKYTCKIILFPEINNEAKVEVELISGPFKHLYNKWTLIRVNQTQTELNFQIEFSFKNSLLEKLMRLFFTKAVNKLTQSFEERIEKIYSIKKIKDS